MKNGINQTYVSTYDGKAASMMEKPNIAKFKPDPKLKLMDQVRQVLRYHHYAYRTEQSYCDWIIRYVKFHGGNTHPAGIGKKEIDAFLSYLATHLPVAAATQRQALNAIVSLWERSLVYVRAAKGGKDRTTV